MNEGEIKRLVDEQAKDDTYRIEHEYMGRFRTLSLSTGMNGDWLAVDIEGRRIPPHDINPRPRRGMYCGGGLTQIPHGTYNGYKNYECRCPMCVRAGRKANIEYNKRWRKRQYETREPRECACGCGETFHPFPITKKFVNHVHADRECKRRKRLRAAA